MLKRHTLILSALIAVAITIGCCPAVASADFGIKPGSFESNIQDSNGAVVASPQAGHTPTPRPSSSSSTPDPANVPARPGRHLRRAVGLTPILMVMSRRLITDLPAGFIGNPQAVPALRADRLPAIGLRRLLAVCDLCAGRRRGRSISARSRATPTRPSDIHGAGLQPRAPEGRGRAVGVRRARDRSSSTSRCAPAATTASPPPLRTYLSP